MVLTLHLSFEYGSQNKQRLLFYTPLTDWFYITEMKRIFIVAPCILETVYYTSTNAPLYYNSLKFLH